MVWSVCKMRLRHMCTFASENLTVKGLTAVITLITIQLTGHPWHELRRLADQVKSNLLIIKLIVLN